MLVVERMALREAWTAASAGRIPPSEQSKLWGAREALRMLGEDDTQYQWMAEQVFVNGKNNHLSKQHPHRQSVKDFFTRVDGAGKVWYPGRADGDAPGAKTQLTPGKRKAICGSMMAAKKRGERPCYDLAKSYCPKAIVNPNTNKPFSRQKINDLLTSERYDKDPNEPWEFRFGCKRRALSAEDMQSRVEWARRLLREDRTAAWFLANIIWVDICSKVIPGNAKKALDQQHAADMRKLQLISPGAAHKSANLGGTVTSDKQAGFGDTRVFFTFVMTRGKIGVDVFTDVAGYPGGTPDGARMLVDRLPALLDTMLGRESRKPRTIFTDRGPGFFHRRWGTITGAYKSALKEHGFSAWAGPNSLQGARAQPGDIPDVLLHETAISWLRRREEKTRPLAPWHETPAQLRQRLQRLAKVINRDLGVRELCMEFPQRLSDLVKKTGGDRLPK